MLIAGPSEALDKYQSNITKRFQVERYIVDQHLILKDLRNNSNHIVYVKCDKEACMLSIFLLELTKERRKQQLSMCFPAELHESLNLLCINEIKRNHCIGYIRTDGKQICIPPTGYTYNGRDPAFERPLSHSA